VVARFFLSSSVNQDALYSQAMVANDDEMVTTDASFDKTRPCVVCGSAKVEDEDLIVVCDNQACDVYVHQRMPRGDKGVGCVSHCLS